MWIIGVFLLTSFLSGMTMLTEDGPYVDPNGGGAMDPNGIVSDGGPGMDPNGGQACYTGCVDPNG